MGLWLPYCLWLVVGQVSKDRGWSLLREWKHMLQGIKIESGGKASSINMATLQYETWESKDGKLILTGKSIGNHRTLSFTDTLMIEKLTQDSLILSKGDYVLRYASVPSVH